MTSIKDQIIGLREEFNDMRDDIISNIKTEFNYVSKYFDDVINKWVDDCPNKPQHWGNFDDTTKKVGEDMPLKPTPGGFARLPRSKDWFSC